MKKTIKHFLLPVALAVAGIGFIGCNDDEDKSASTIMHYKWELVYFADADGNREVPQGKNSRTDWIEFINDSIFKGHSMSNLIEGHYSINQNTKTLTFSSIGGTEIVEYYDGERFISCLRNVYRFDISADILKLYHDNEDYLELRKEK